MMNDEVADIIDNDQLFVGQSFIPTRMERFGLLSSKASMNGNKQNLSSALYISFKIFAGYGIPC